MPTIRITVDGKPAVTVEQAADRYGLKPASVRSLLVRNDVEPDAYLDGRKPLYVTSRLDAIVKARPGKGEPGVPRPERRKPLAE